MEDVFGVVRGKHATTSATGRRESKQASLCCVWVSSTNADGGFIGAKKEQKSCKALQVEGAECHDRQLGGSNEGRNSRRAAGGGEGLECVCRAVEQRRKCVMEPRVSLSASSTTARGLQP